MSEVVVREIANGIWFLLGAFLIVAFGIRIWQRFQVPGWYKDEGTQLLIALFVYFCGSIIRSGWIWGVLVCSNDRGRDDCAVIIQRYDVLLLASVLALVGLVCCIRILTPPHWQPWPWIVSGVLAVAIPVGVHWI